MLLGEQTPRICNVPEYASSAGTEAVELAASAGLNLDPWQQYVLCESLGETTPDKWSAFEIALVVARQCGKGSILEARELAGLFLFGEELILHSSHEFKTTVEAFRRVLSLITNTDHLRRLVHRVRTSHGDEGIELRTGQRLRFIARSKSSGRGFSGDCVILDEAFNLSGESMAALLPTVSARRNPQIWYTSSAGMESSEYLRTLRQRGMIGNSPGLAYFEWSAAEDCDLDDRHAWAQANPALGYRISEQAIALERDALPEEQFRRERLGIWPDLSGDAVIDPAQWLRLVDRDSSIADGSPLVLAVDISPLRDAACIGVAGVRSDGLAHIELVEHRAGTGWLVDRLVDVHERHQASAVVLDPGGPAGAILPSLRDRGLDPVLVNAREMAQACGAFQDAVTNGDLRHRDDPALNAAVQGARVRAMGEAWCWTRKTSSVDIGPLVTVTLALRGVATHQETKPARPLVAWV